MYDIVISPEPAGRFEETVSQVKPWVVDDGLETMYEWKEARQVEGVDAK